MGLYSKPSNPDQDWRLQRYYSYLLDEVNSGVNTYWLSKPLQTSVGQRHALKVEGGDKSFRYSASLQWNDIRGVMKESYRKTFNGAIIQSVVIRIPVQWNILNIRMSRATGETGDLLPEDSGKILEEGKITEKGKILKEKLWKKRVRLK